MTGPANPEVAVAALLKDLSPTELASLVGKLEEERKRYAKAEELVEAEIAEARTSLGEGAPPTPTREGFVVVDGDDTVSTLQSAVRELGKGLVEREEEVRLVLLAALTGEHLLLLGPPGTAKSELGRRLSACFGSGAYFERLLTKFSTPEELFGPVSIKGLERDVYERKSEGYLPQASFAFVDEIFKANSAILNTLLTLLNERVFHNGTAPTPCPLVCLIGASNELPESEELEALYDRFLLRRWVSPVSDEGFAELLNGRLPEGGITAVLDEELVMRLRAAAAAVEVPHHVALHLLQIKKRLRSVGDETSKCTVSDRRWRKVVGLLRMVAAAHGRQQVAVPDLLVLAHCLWATPEQRTKVSQLLINIVATEEAKPSASQSTAHAAVKAVVDTLEEVKAGKGPSAAHAIAACTEGAKGLCSTFAKEDERAKASSSAEAESAPDALEQRLQNHLFVTEADRRAVLKKLPAGGSRKAAAGGKGDAKAAKAAETRAAALRTAAEQCHFARIHLEDGLEVPDKTLASLREAMKKLDPTSTFVAETVLVTSKDVKSSAASNSGNADRALSSSGTHYQSGGSCPHHVQFELKQEGRTFCGSQLMDIKSYGSSYEPEKVDILCGESASSLKKVKSLKLPTSGHKNFVLVKAADVPEGTRVIRFVSNQQHSHGGDTRIGGIRLYATPPSM
eukprot:CAMPEP_0170138510 /NCGR_PEP_ID=MMETSP0033_2-20121228/4978_1 /TAXON_ID=195969 /ORGANISM="Dolichomastix tenuilepis, Strain CCMP3274" /LENGTH=680 /DNA_ID=CAMNT_0010374531 /DNA_START=104 /DNA_END=2146 /DNA_ORIENTATION=+